MVVIELPGAGPQTDWISTETGPTSDRFPAAGVAAGLGKACESEWDQRTTTLHVYRMYQSGELGLFAVANKEHMLSLSLQSPQGRGSMAGFRDP